MTIQVIEKSLELALVKAAGKLGITQDDLEYRIQKQSTGFLGVFGKKVSIEAWQKGQESEGRRQLDSDEIESLKQGLKQFCSELCEKMIGEKVQIELIDQENRLVLNIQNDFFARQFSRGTKISEAFEHILRKQPRHLRQELPFRIFVDAGNVRTGRETELAEMAQDLSNKVHENKRPIVLNYRSSYDRKIIHMALDKDERVYTKSIGSGPNRKLMILPSKEQKEGVVEPNH